MTAPAPAPLAPELNPHARHRYTHTSDEATTRAFVAAYTLANQRFAVAVPGHDRKWMVVVEWEEGRVGDVDDLYQWFLRGFNRGVTHARDDAREVDEQLRFLAGTTS